MMVVAVATAATAATAMAGVAATGKATCRTWHGELRREANGLHFFSRNQMGH